jgi:mRNA interferase HicA
MKRRDLIRHLEDHGCRFFREGSNHTLYYNPEKNVSAAVPRHNEIGTAVARKICKELEIPITKKK